MSAIRASLIEQALAQGGTPCARKATLEECFTEEGGKVVLWFNTPDHSTHVVMGVES